jgi:hypothetical protein
MVEMAKVATKCIGSREAVRDHLVAIGMYEDVVQLAKHFGQLEAIYVAQRTPEGIKRTSYRLVSVKSDGS